MTYGRNSAVICVSEAVRESVVGYPGPRPVVVPNGVPALAATTGDRVREEFGIGADTKLIVHVGNIRPHKGHENLINATTKLVEMGEDCVVLSVGGEKHQGDLERVRRSAADNGISSAIRFLGRRTDARRLLGAADLVVNPSDVEGLPIALLEAMAMARPVVATDVGGVASLVKDEATGLLVPPADPDSLASAISRALHDPDASKWGQAGASLVQADHGMAGMIRSYEATYRKILGA
jgi:glycosyltransferase involved in cell wall biosynthesis